MVTTQPTLLLLHFLSRLFFRGITIWTSQKTDHKWPLMGEVKNTNGKDQK